MTKLSMTERCDKFPSLEYQCVLAFEHEGECREYAKRGESPFLTDDAIIELTYLRAIAREVPGILGGPTNQERLLKLHDEWRARV